MEGDAIAILGTSVLTGIVSTLGTVGALKVHITYLKEITRDLKRSADRAHERLDDLEKRFNLR